jgi:hypothetical protein
VERLAADPVAAHRFEPPWPGDLVPRVIAAVERLDGLLLERLLTHAAATVGPMGFLEAVAAPAMAEVGR